MVEHWYKIEARPSDINYGKIGERAFAIYHEEAQIDALRSWGLSYKEVEISGIIIPAVRYSVEFIEPFYGESDLKILVRIRKRPSIKIEFEFEVYNNVGLLVNKATMTNAIIDQKANKFVQLPPELMEKLEMHFS